MSEHQVTDFNDNFIGYDGYIASKTNVVPKIGIGILFNYTDNMAFRIISNFERHSKIKLKFAPNNNYKPFKDSYMVLSGVIFKF